MCSRLALKCCTLDPLKHAAHSTLVLYTDYSIYWNTDEYSDSWTGEYSHSSGTGEDTLLFYFPSHSIPSFLSFFLFHTYLTLGRLCQQDHRAFFLKGQEGREEWRRGKRGEAGGEERRKGEERKREEGGEDVGSQSGYVLKVRPVGGGWHTLKVSTSDLRTWVFISSHS